METRKIGKPEWPPFSPATQISATPASEVQNVADYQQGWNDAQAKRSHKFDASIHYSMGFVDGTRATGSVQ